MKQQRKNAYNGYDHAAARPVQGAQKRNLFGEKYAETGSSVQKRPVHDPFSFFREQDRGALLDAEDADRTAKECRKDPQNNVKRIEPLKDRDIDHGGERIIRKCLLHTEIAENKQDQKLREKRKQE